MHMGRYSCLTTCAPLVLPTTAGQAKNIRMFTDLGVIVTVSGRYTRHELFIACRKDTDKSSYNKNTNGTCLARTYDNQRRKNAPIARQRALAARALC